MKTEFQYKDDFITAQFLEARKGYLSYMDLEDAEGLNL